MNQVERLRYIQDALSRQDFVSLENLCAGLDVSRATVRRDLIELERSQNIHRVHGGSCSPPPAKRRSTDFWRLLVSSQKE
jgi:DeoR/GlpR family transcriptional regulator of sugar metabolism